MSPKLTPRETGSDRTWQYIISIGIWWAKQRTRGMKTNRVKSWKKKYNLQAYVKIFSIKNIYWELWWLLEEIGKETISFQRAGAVNLLKETLLSSYSLSVWSATFPLSTFFYFYLGSPSGFMTKYHTMYGSARNQQIQEILFNSLPYISSF